MSRPPVPYQHARAPGGRAIVLRAPRHVVERETREALDELERAEAPHVEVTEDTRASDVLEQIGDDARKR